MAIVNDDGIEELSESPWSAPVALLRKNMDQRGSVFDFGFKKRMLAG